MRYLALDYGSKRIGIALSDEEGKIAFPHSVLPNEGPEKTIKSLNKLVRDEKISKVIVGLPVPFSGKENEQTKEVRKFIRFLEKKTALPVEETSELLTTKSVGSSSKEMKDASAAAIILQSYLDRKSTI